MSVERPSLSVVVPTHRRPALLLQSLAHLEAQTVRDQMEVIVVSDGFDQETTKAVASTQWAMRLTYLEIPKQQQGTARNHGVRHATADTCLFVQDDIFLAPTACDEHLLSHAALQYSEEQFVAVLGYTEWDPEMVQTPTMKWLDKTGWQFGYKQIEDYAEDFVPVDVQHRYTYTSHLSLPTAIARRFPFREDVTLYGWEDIEWGMRLRDGGVKLFYAPNAKAVHHHPLTLEQSLKRMEILGESLVQLSAINPALDRMPKGWKRTAYEVLSHLPTMRGLHAKAFMKGIKRGEKAV